jgi:hypothetical protein
LTPEEQRLYDLLRPILERHGSEILDQIAAGQGVSFDALSSDLQTALRTTLLQAILDGVDTLSDTVALGVDTALTATAASTWASTYSYSLVRGLTDTTRTIVQNAVSVYHATPGMTRGELELLLRPAFGARRAEAIAITEISRAAAEATNQTQQGLADLGLTMERVWRTNNDERTCPICGPLNGKPESAWRERFPSGPPAHPRCRCFVTLRRAQ